MVPQRHDSIVNQGQLKARIGPGGQSLAFGDRVAKSQTPFLSLDRRYDVSTQSCHFPGDFGKGRRGKEEEWKNQDCYEDCDKDCDGRRVFHGFRLPCDGGLGQALQICYGRVSSPAGAVGPSAKSRRRFNLINKGAATNMEE